MDDYRPSSLGLISQTATSIELSWTVSPRAKSGIDHFDIRYHTLGEIKWKTIETDQNRNSFQVTELKSDTRYEFKVRSALPNGDESPFCDISVFKTMASLTDKMKAEGTKLTGDELPAIYKIPLDQLSSKNRNKTRKTRLRTQTINPAKQEKTIMVVGATGAGKSTLIDGLINFYLDVAWEEEARFKLIDLTPEEQKKTDESKSQTEWITCYVLPWMPGCRINYNLNIIDTPGFGDCRGIERDKKIVEQIKKFFSSSQDHGIECLDAVWFVTQAPMCKLTPTQRYIFDSVLSIFGADIKENIFVLITFADSQQPPVLHAIKEADIPHQGTFKFNNSALFVNPSISPDDKVAWKMGKKGFEEFFTGLRKVRTKSLTLTKEVLQLRKKLEDHISRIQKEIMRGTEEQLKMREEERILKLHERDIADNMNFKYKVKEVKVVKIDLPTGIHTTTCLICNFTCHEDCIYANDDHKMLCWAMDQNFCQDCLAKPEPERVGCWCSMNKHCRICENRCIWSEHKNQPYLIQAQEIYAEKTYEEMMKKYVSAQDEKGKAINILEKIKENYETVMERNKELVAKVKDYINRLKEIALKPNPMSELDYINILIENENEGKKDGYQERIHILKELHEKAKIRAQIAEELDKEDTSLKLNKRLNQGYSSTNTESPKQINRMKSSTSIASNTHTVTPKQTNRSIPAVKTVARTQPTITKQINQIKPSVSAELDKENSLLDSSNLTEREDLDSPTLPNKDNTNFVQSGQNAKSISPEHKNHMGPSVNTVTEYTPNQAHQMENVHAATKKSKMCHVM